MKPQKKCPVCGATKDTPMKIKGGLIRPAFVYTRKVFYCFLCQLGVNWAGIKKVG